MSSAPCPFCGEMMSASIRFCTGCGRSITKEDLSRVSLKLGKGQRGEDGGQSFDLSRKDHDTTRQVRTFLYTIAAMVALMIAYYCTMKFVLHEHIPGNLDLVIDQMITGKQVVPQDVPASQTRSAPEKAQPQSDQ